MEPFNAMSEEFSKILTEISVDNFNFQVTPNPFEEGGCILWFRDTLTHISFMALGKFASFDKRKVLDFVVRYVSNPLLRTEISERHFKAKVDSISLKFFEQIELADYSAREEAYRHLYDLNSEIPHPTELSHKRRVMTHKFHPDKGGSNQAMSIINEAYDYLSALEKNKNNHKKKSVS